MHRLKYILAIVCLLCGHAVVAQYWETIDWQKRSVDSVLSLEVPILPLQRVYDKNNGFIIYDSTMAFAVRTLDLKGELDELKGMNNEQKSWHVYNTYIARQRSNSTFEIVPKKWQLQANEYCMLMWYPVSDEALQDIVSVKGAHRIDNFTEPPVVRFERLLYYNNTLYVFSVICITAPYHNDYYYDLGGLPVNDLDKLKNKFFRSIRVKKLPREK